MYKRQLEFLREILAPTNSEDDEEIRHIRRAYEKGHQFFVTPYSGLFLDEIAIGTDEEETVTRARVVLNEVSARGTLTYLATHCHRIVDFVEKGEIPGAINIGAVVKQQNGQVVYLRKMQPGARMGSYGHLVAEEVGVTPEILEKGRKIIGEIIRPI